MTNTSENKEKTFRVYGLAFSNDFDKVYLVKKTRPDKQKELMTAMGGISDWYKEDVAQGMTREFNQETAVLVDPSKWVEIENKSAEESNVLFYTTRLELWMIPYSSIGQHLWGIHWKNYTQRTWQNLSVSQDIFYLINKAYYLHQSAVNQPLIE